MHKDTIDDNTVDKIPLSPQLKADSKFGRSETYYGLCGKANMAVKVNTTSDCRSNWYGPQCTKQCVSESQEKTCNYIGESICNGNFKEPDCRLCDENFYPIGSCNILCIPRNNYWGHYRCNPVNGNRICLEGYKDPSTYCVNKDNHG